VHALNNFASPRVLIVDDHAACAEAFARVLLAESDWTVVGIARDLKTAVDQARLHQPEVLVCEYGIPGVGGASLITHLRAASPKGRVLVVSARAEKHRVATALRVGAAGFVAKTASLADVWDALRRVSRGEIVIGAGLLTGAISALRDEASPMLTEREMQAIELASQGLSNAQIAAGLGIRPNTARNHLQRAFEKLGVHSRVEAVVHAQRLGLVAVPA
jgi:DNA-binding NarL/FixJ family response regulator